MELNTEQFRQWLRALKSEGVEEIHWTAEGLHVRFGPGTSSSAVDVTDKPRNKPESKSVWDNPALWAGGSPPRFPTSE